MTETSAAIVLYADDDIDDLELVQEAFASYTRNVEFITAKNGSEVLSLLAGLDEDQALPCLIILDVNMPIINGKEVLTRLRAVDRFANVPIVLFTTSSLRDDREFAKKHNAGFITKPLDVSQMEAITELFIDHCSDEIKKNIKKII